MRGIRKSYNHIVLSHQDVTEILGRLSVMTTPTAAEAVP